MAGDEAPAGRAAPRDEIRIGTLAAACAAILYGTSYVATAFALQSFTHDEVFREGYPRPGAAYLQKPFMRGHLAGAVGALLDGRTGAGDGAQDSGSAVRR